MGPLLTMRSINGPEAGQEDQLSTPGARLKATGPLGNGEAVQAQLRLQEEV